MSSVRIVFLACVVCVRRFSAFPRAQRAHRGLGRGSCRHVRDTQRETSPRIATHRHVSPRSALSPFSARVSAPRTARQRIRDRHTPTPAHRRGTNRPTKVRVGGGSAAAAIRSSTGSEGRAAHARARREARATHPLATRRARVRKFAPFCESIFSHAARGARYLESTEIPTVRAARSLSLRAPHRDRSPHVSPRSATHRRASPRIATYREKSHPYKRLVPPQPRPWMCPSPSVTTVQY